MPKIVLEELTAAYKQIGLVLSELIGYIRGSLRMPESRQIIMNTINRLRRALVELREAEKALERKYAFETKAEQLIGFIDEELKKAEAI